MLETLKKLPGKVQNEWAKSIFLVLLLLGIGGLALGLGKLRSLLKEQQHSGSARPKIEKVFGPGAFASVLPQKRITLPFDHCFVIKRPPGWQPPGTELAAVMPPPEETSAKVVQKDSPREGRRLPVKRHVIKVDLPDELKVPQPIRHYLVYKGFMKTAKGHMAAYLTEEKEQGDKKSPGMFDFLLEGGKFGSYVVISFDEKAVVLKNTNGGQVSKHFVGERRHYATTPGG